MLLEGFEQNTTHREARARGGRGDPKPTPRPAYIVHILLPLFAPDDFFSKPDPPTEHMAAG